MKDSMNQVYPLKKTWPLWTAVLILGLFMVFFRIGNDALWYDESYSVAAAQHPVTQMIPMIGMDSHPPLYFIILRGLLLVFGDSLVSVRSASALGILGLAFLGFYPLRKLAGEKTGLAFALIVFLTPMSIVSAHEARMYSWAAFLVTGMVLFGYIAVTGGRRRDWLFLSLFTLAAAYTHYFSLMAAGLFWLILLIRLIVTRDRKGLIHWGISAAFLLALYSPWFLFLVKQASRVKKNYWIPPVDLGMILRVLSYPFSQKFKWTPDLGKVGLFLVVAATGVTSAVILKRRKDPRWFIPLSGLLVFSLTLLASLILSKLFRPILMERYMISCMGALLLSLAFFAGLWTPRWFTPAVLGLYLLTGIGTMLEIYNTEINGPMDQVQSDLKDKVKPEDVFVHGSEHNMGTFSYYFPENRHYLYIPENFVPFSNYEVFSHRGRYGSDYGIFNNEPVTIWVTNRAGEFYSMPFSLIGKAPYRRAKGSVMRYNKAPGWYSVSIQEILYAPEKTTADPDVNIIGSGDLRIIVRGLKADQGGKLLLGLFREEPISPQNVFMGDMKEVNGDTLEFVFKNIEYGTFGLYGFHDINGNEELDMKGTVPAEGVATSLKKPPAGGFPTFEELEFSFDVETSDLEITAVYF